MEIKAAILLFRTLRLSEGTIAQNSAFSTKAHLIHNNTIFLIAIKAEARKKEAFEMHFFQFETCAYVQESPFSKRCETLAGFEESLILSRFAINHTFGLKIGKT